MADINLYKTWQRPSMVIFSASAPVVVTASTGLWTMLGTAGTDYIFLTDDNRSDMDISVDRIENKKRMINGTMRSYHVADKSSFSFTYTDIPSQNTYISEVGNPSAADAVFAGGAKILDWYRANQDSFWMLLVYDTPSPQGSGSIPVKYKVEKYNVFFDSFNFNVKKRALDHDLWDISISLVEV